MPRLLRGLAAPDLRTASQAGSELFEHICHQGTLYPATPAAVPFLLEVLADPSVQVAEDVLVMLAVIGRGAAWPDPYDQPWDRHRDREPHERLVGGAAERRERARAAREAIGAGTPLLLGLLDHPDLEVRRLVPAVLAKCPERAGEIVPALRARLPHEPDAATGAAIVLGVARLAAAGGANPRELEWLAALLEGGVGAAARLAAAVGLAWTGPAELPSRVVDAMAATLGGERAAGVAELDWDAVWLESPRVRSILVAVLIAHRQRRQGTRRDVRSKPLTGRRTRPGKPALRRRAAQ